MELRKKLITSSEDNPQGIRNDSAMLNRYLPIDSAISAESAESARGSENILLNTPEEVADSADFAEQQTIHADIIADELRNDCGLNNSITVNKEPIDLLKTVSCHDCEHFLPDQIGDGAGIGNCNVGIKSTKIAGYITMPLSYIVIQIDIVINLTN